MGLLNHETNPISSLIAAFTAWKGLLLAIALGASVGPDYDTSTSLFFNIVHGPATPVPALATRLTRWDALYFMHDAVKGKVYEQEWAFGIGLPAVVRGINELFGLEGWDAIIAIAISHVSHIIAVLSLYQLTIVLCNDRKLAYLAAAVHILSPGGLFLSAPYAESTFACLSFVGNLLFALSLKASPDSLRRNISVIGAGLLYGVSCIFRSNGLFGGVLFAVEAIKGLTALLGGFTFSKALRLVAPVIGGLFVAVGFVAPQILAWMRYCNVQDNGEQRPWCTRPLPSIYTFVQEEYWNVGFLRYWTPNQIPLFLLAAPMLTILIKSGTEVMRGPSRGLRAMISGTDEQFRLLVRTLAAVQTLLAVLAITNYHVQIISRISSAYPVWYWWVASCLMDSQRQNLGYGIIMFIITLTHTHSIKASLLFPQPTPNMSATGQQPDQQPEHRSNGSSSTAHIILGLLTPPPTPPPLTSGPPPPPSQPPDTTPYNGICNCIEMLVETEEVEEQEQDTAKTISPPLEATAGFGSTVKTTLLSLKALWGDLQAIVHNQASRACQPSSR
ncbi:GPI mannosyltransferase 2 [Fusarium oxysporum f. sp. raphani]|nr:GPI mannosyltransferase 2 [Fusarium oxysporum f. sp. raphani]